MMSMDSFVGKTHWHLKRFNLNVPVKHVCRSTISRNIDAVRKHGWNLYSIVHAPPVGLEGQWEDCLLTFHLRLGLSVKHAERLELNINNYIVVQILYCCIILIKFEKKMVVEIKQRMRDFPRKLRMRGQLVAI